jgi:murein DD-endopeptidase MepM/ murein hydrolase activator NlpD
MQSTSVSSLFNTTSSTGETEAQTASTNDVKSEFRDLLTAMLLSSFTSQSTSGSDSSGMGFQQLLAPLMLSLLEKLFSQDVQTTDAQEQKEEVTTSKPVNSPQGKPVKGGVLTQGSHPGHIALDLGIPVGTPVKATMDGKVVYAGWNNEGYGNLVIVENGPYRTYFAHLSDFTVKVGDKVTAGQKVALSGNTGNSTGPHLHYEVRKNGAQIDPTSFTL